MRSTTDTEQTNDTSDLFTACSTQTTNYINFCIGCDTVTGRVKWCPDCKFIKYCLLLPVIMIPVILVFLIIIEINVLGAIEYTGTGYSGESSGQEHSVNCKTYKRIVSEPLDIYEKELFRDIRTSFVPSGSIVVAENCEQTHLRQRRDVSLQNETSSEEFLSDPVNESVDPTDSSPSERPFEIPALLKTFWKGGKTAEQIRSSQVDIMKQYMDTSAKPCDDFYQYACGNWEKLNPIPKDKAAYDTFEMLREILDIELKNLLGEKEVNCTSDNSDVYSKPAYKLFDIRNSIETIKATAESLKRKNVKKRAVIFRPRRRRPRPRYRRTRAIESNECQTKLSSAEQKAKYLYQSCMNTDILNKRGVEPLLQLLKVLGDWPVLAGASWNVENFDWLQLAGILRLYNNDIFIMQWVGPDIKNSDENVIQFDQTTLGLPTRDYFLQV